MITFGEQISIRAKVDADIKPTYTACSFKTPHVGITLVAVDVTKNIMIYFIKFVVLNIYYRLDIICLKSLKKVLFSFIK